jgi:hypothetical protein
MDQDKLFTEIFGGSTLAHESVDVGYNLAGNIFGHLFFEYFMGDGAKEVDIVWTAGAVEAGVAFFEKV